MSDYLTTLAARTIATPSLTPRLRMRFEPETKDLVPPAEERVERTAPPPPRARIAQTEPLAPAPRPRENAIERETARHVTTAPVEPAQSRPPAQRIEHVTSLQPETRVVERVIERVEVPRAIEREPQPVVRTVAAPPRTHVVERVSEHTETIEKRTDATHHVIAEKQQAAPRPHRLDLQPPRVEREHSRTFERIVMAEPRVLERDRVIRERGATPFARAPIAAPQSEPAVQVSIGRIEVRATTQQTPRASSRTRSVMTIDDYVAKQKERR